MAAAVDTHRPSSVVEEVELLVLESRLQLLQSQRQLCAVHCERFTSQLEVALRRSSRTSASAAVDEVDEQDEAQDEWGAVLRGIPRRPSRASMSDTAPSSPSSHRHMRRMHRTRRASTGSRPVDLYYST